MEVNIHHLIAAISPDVYCAAPARRAVKRMVKDALQQGDAMGYLKAAAAAKLREPNRISLEKLELINPFTLPGFQDPIEQHVLVYDSFEASLESFYFWLLDQLSAEEGWKVTKLLDNFAAAPGSGLFADLARRGTSAQQAALKLLKEAHDLVRAILRLSSDLEQQRQQLRNTEETGESDVTARPSEPGQRQRFEIEKQILRNKVETLKLYARWLHPYLRTARQLGERATPGAALVTVFNTAAIEVTLLAEAEYRPEQDVDRGDLARMILHPRQRNYASVLLVELRIRAAPEQTSRGAYGFRGRNEIVLSSYALNADELAVLRREVERDEMGNLIGALEGAAVGSLGSLLKEIEGLLKEPEKPKAQSTDTNPFSALFAFGEIFGRANKENRAAQEFDERIGICPDSDIEEVLRSQAILAARKKCQEIYNLCKQAHNMPCF